MRAVRLPATPLNRVQKHRRDTALALRVIGRAYSVGIIFLLNTCLQTYYIKNVYCAFLIHRRRVN